MIEVGTEFLQAIFLTIILSAIPLGVVMFVGLVVSVLQAATQIQEHTLTFVPKLVAIGLVLFFCGTWMVEQVVSYFQEVLLGIGS